MAFCFRCQCFTENLNQEFRLTKNGRERECSLCALCNCEKSRFVGKKRKRKNTSSTIVSRPPQTAYMVDDHDVGSSAFNEYPITRSTSNDTAEEKNIWKIRLSNAIEHQWRIDHIPGYYTNYKRRREEQK